MEPPPRFARWSVPCPGAGVRYPRTAGSRGAATGWTRHARPGTMDKGAPVPGGGMHGSNGREDVVSTLRTLLEQRILVLDGAWGTMLQGAGLTPADYRADGIGDGE